MQITSLMSKEVQTRYGLKQKWVATIQKQGQAFTFDAFVGEWNRDWAVGTDIEPQADQWKSRVYEGKTYWTLQAPAEARRSFNPELENKLADLTKRVEVLEVMMANKTSPEAMELHTATHDMVKEEVDLSTVPF